MEHNAITVFQRSMETCADPAEIARKVKLAFKRMPGEVALACFAKVMTAELPHQIKVAVWDAVRYSHIWWGVDEVLKGKVMENPIVQQAFGDAVPMRKWIVDNECESWKQLAMTLDDENSVPIQIRVAISQNPQVRLLGWIRQITHGQDTDVAFLLQGGGRPFVSGEQEAIANWRDWRGNNILWYLTYRDDQNAQGGFACPEIERALLRLGVDPDHCNNLGLCWNDVRRHVIREAL